MLRKSIVAAALMLTSLGAVRPASADLKFLEPYGGIYSGRTLLGSPLDSRAKDALQSQPSTPAGARQRFVISPLFAHSDDHGGEVTSFGGTLAYANSVNPGHPWQIQGSGLNNHVTVGGAGRADIRQFDFTGKFVLFQPRKENLPVVSFVGRYADFDALGDRYDLLLAADHAIDRRLFATANLGWSRSYCDPCESSSALIAGFGATYVVSPKLSISADYTVSNDVDGTDLWTVAASYNLGRNSLVRLGGGKNGTLGQNRGLVFLNYVLKFDRK